MKTIRILLGLTGLLTILAITATPAAAEFEADQPNTTQGPYQLTGANPVFTAPTGQEITCNNLKNGIWHEQTKFTKVVVDKESITKVEQDLTKRGPHQAITGQFEGCTGPLAIAAEVNSTCSLQIEQHAKEFRGSVISRCIITIPLLGCIIKIPAGNPNTQLTEVNSINIEKQNKEDISNVMGIFSTVNENCTNNGIGGGVGNTFTGHGIAHSQKVI